MSATAREKAEYASVKLLDLAIVQAVHAYRDAWGALDEHDRNAPSASSVSAAQVRDTARVQLRQRLTSARDGLDCLLRSDA